MEVTNIPFYQFMISQKCDNLLVATTNASLAPYKIMNIRHLLCSVITSSLLHAYCHCIS